MTFPVPPSLKTYYGEPAVFKAVNDLAANLTGDKTPEGNREDARNYNQALLMTAQVRADFIDLLFRVWDETFGRADIVGKERFESKQFTIPKIWDWGWLGVRHFAEDDGRSDLLYVYQTVGDPAIGLAVERYSKNETPACPPKISLKGWEIYECWTESRRDYNWAFTNDTVDMVEFLDDPLPTLRRFRRDAIEMANFLTHGGGVSARGTTRRR